VSERVGGVTSGKARTRARLDPETIPHRRPRYPRRWWFRTT
jgi:hypothetical protein